MSLTRSCGMPEQMFLVEQEPATSSSSKPSTYSEKYQLYSGLTPPTKDLSRRWKKRKPKVREPLCVCVCV